MEKTSSVNLGLSWEIPPQAPTSSQLRSSPSPRQYQPLHLATSPNPKPHNRITMPNPAQNPASKPAHPAPPSRPSPSRTARPNGQGLGHPDIRQTREYKAAVRRYVHSPNPTRPFRQSRRSRYLCLSWPYVLFCSGVKPANQIPDGHQRSSRCRLSCTRLIFSTNEVSFCLPSYSLPPQLRLLS